MKFSFKVILSVSILGLVIGCGYQVSNAAYPVVDAKNIAQQIKTCAETVKVVTNTAQQITMMAKNLKSLPKQILNKHVQEYQDSINITTNAISNIGGIFKTGATGDTWNSGIPQLNIQGINGMVGQIDISNIISAKSEADAAAKKTQSDVNTASAVALPKLIHEVDKAQKRLIDLNDKIKDAEGAKEIQQLTAMISSTNVQIQALHTKINAIKTHAELVEKQAAVTEAQNRKKTDKAIGEANNLVLKKMHDNTPKTLNPYDLCL